MSDCWPYNGTATVERVEDELRWTRFDEGVHASDEVTELDVFLDKYEVVERCPKMSEVYHCRMR